MLQRLIDVPRETLIRNIISINPYVVGTLFPNKNIADLNQFELGAVVLYLEEEGANILQKIFAPKATEFSPEIEELLRRWSEEDDEEPQHRIVERLLTIPNDRLIATILRYDPSVTRKFFDNRNISELSRPELVALILYLEGESTTGGPLWSLIN